MKVDRTPHSHRPSVNARASADAQAARTRAPVRDDGKIVSVYKDAFVTVYSDEKLTRAEAKKVAERVQDAYAYNRERNGLDPSKAPKKPLEVAVLSRDGFEDVTGQRSRHVAGLALSPSQFVLRDTAALSRGGAADEVIAHELSHLIDFRRAGARISRVPQYLQEGEGQLTGLTHATRHGGGTAQVEKLRGELSSLDGKEALEVFRNARTERQAIGRVGQRSETGNTQAFRDQATGALFLEFLRTRFNGGDAEVNVKLDRATRATGKGASWDEAFQAQFGSSLKDAEAAFARFLDQTKNDLTDRFAGTLFDRAHLGRFS